MTRDRVMAGIVFLVALALRVSVIAELQPLPLFRTPQLDSLEYLEWAERYAAGDFSWPARPSHGPGYPMFLGAILAATGSLAAARVVQAVVGALTCVLVYSIALRSFGRRAATAAGLLAAAYAPLILADVSILAEGLLVFLLAAALRLSQSERWTAIGAAGLALGSAAIVRPTALAVLPLVLWAVWRARPSPKALALFLAAVAYPLAPAMLHTWRETGQIVLVQAGGGMNTYIGNSPKHDGTAWARPGGEWDALQGAAWRAGLVKPAEEDSFYLRQLRREIVEEPLGFARVLASKAMWLIQDEEVRDSHSFHFFAAESAVLRWTLRFGVLLALAVAGVVVAPRRDLVLPVYLLIMALTVVALVAGSRYRLPVVLPLFVYGGVAIVAIRRRAVPAIAAAVAVLLVSNLWTHAESHDFTEELAMTALAASKEGNNDVALAAAQKAVELNPRRSDAWTALGDVQARLSRWEEAEQSWRRAVAIDPNTARAWAHIGYARWQRRDVQGARTALRRSLAIRLTAEAAENLAVAEGRR